MVMNQNPKPIQGMFLLVDRKSEDGMRRWLDELQNRKMPALVAADGWTISRKPDLVRRMADIGLDVGCVYNDGALWTETMDDVVAWLPSWLPIDQAHLKSSREIQTTIMRTICDRLRPLTGKTLPVFAGKYFSYDENTLTIADELGIPFVLARGTQQARAVFYKPLEYGATLISVSNVPSRELGTGSLCDESLESRNETPEAFRRLLFDLVVDRVILVAQTHVSGLKQAWWDIYQEFFDSGLVQWHSLADFVRDPQVMPYKDIPVNKRVDYMRIHLEKAKFAGEMV